MDEVRETADGDVKHWYCACLLFVFSQEKMHPRAYAFSYRIKVSEYCVAV